MTIRRSQELNSDFIGFGEITRCRMSRKEWERFDWRRLFSEIPITLKVSSVIKRTGVVLERIKVW